MNSELVLLITMCDGENLFKTVLVLEDVNKYPTEMITCYKEPMYQRMLLGMLPNHFGNIVNVEKDIFEVVFTKDINE